MKKYKATAVLCVWIAVSAVFVGGCTKNSSSSGESVETISETGANETSSNTDESTDNTSEEGNDAVSSSVKSISYYNRNDELEKQYTYDEDGQLIQYNDYSSGIYTVYEYEDGKETARMLYKEGSDSPYQQFGNYQYDDSGRVLYAQETYNESSTEADTGSDYYLYEYDSAGNITKEERPHRYTLYEYDAYNNLIKMENYEYDELKTVEEYTYESDSDGKPLSASISRPLVDGYENSDSSVYEGTYVYDGNNLTSIMYTYTTTGEQAFRYEYQYFD